MVRLPDEGGSTRRHRAPSKFPLTNNYFRSSSPATSLRLAKDVSSRPSLLGISVPTELADESFSVYDHPKVLFFENRGRLPAGRSSGRS